jgi:hypothetical protein
MSIKNVNIIAPEVITNVSDLQKEANITLKETIVNTVYENEIVSLDPSLEVNVELAGLGENNLPESGKFKFNQDFANVTDSLQTLLTLLRNLSDTASVSDSIVISRLLPISAQDLVNSVDSYFISITKNITESTPVLDNVSKSIEKTLNDVATNIDTLLLNFGKNVSDSIGVSDVTSTVTNFNRLTSDFVTATDDILGEANIDDDQYFTIGKVTLDAFTTLDSIDIVSAFVRTFSDILSVTDAVNFSANKSSLDNIVITDTLENSFNKSNSDNAAVTDTVITASAYSRALLETVMLTDISYFSISLNLSESAVVIDNFNGQLAAFLSPNLNESFGIPDTILLNLQRITSEEAFVNDTVFNSIGNIYSESVSTADSLNLSVDSSISEQLLIADSGSLNLQDYFADPSYVVPGYNGVVYTF